MGLVDYEFSSSSDGDETKLKKPSKPPSAMTSNSELNRATTTTQSKKSKKPAKRGERRQLTANFFLPPKMQAALLAGDISSDSDDDNGIDEGQSAKIRVRKDGEKGLLDILPAPSSSGKSKGGGSLGDAAASIIASARIMKMTKESNRCAVDITTTKSKPVEEEEDDEEEEEEEEEEQQEDIIASVKEEIELKSKVKKTNTLMSQSTSSILGDTTTIQKQQQQLYSSPHDDPSVPPKSTITIKQVYNHHDDPITTSWSSSSHSGSVYGTAIEGVQPVVRKNHIPTSSYSAAAQTTQQFVPAAYYNNVGNNECHQPQGTNTSWSNDNNLDSQVGNSRRGNKRNLDRMLASGNLQALEQPSGAKVQVTNLQGYDPSSYDFTVDDRGNPGSTKAEGTNLQRRKHQINTLAAQAKTMERELLENAGRGKLTKAQTQAKYGW